MLYRLAGDGDDDGTWISAGRAHFILVNLLAEGEARPMIVVMPDIGAGWTSAARATAATGMAALAANQDAFAAELTSVIIPTWRRTSGCWPIARFWCISGALLEFRSLLQERRCDSTRCS